MKSLLELRCPSCAANLTVEDDAEYTFCSYCGTKILITDENRYTFRHIDDAEVTRAQTERMVQMKETELEEKSQRLRKKLIILWISVTLIMLIVSIIIIAANPDDGNGVGYMLLLLTLAVGGWGAIGIFGFGKNKRRHSQIRSGDSVTITDGIARYYGKNYRELTTQLQGIGFVNVTAIPMNDLNSLTIRKNGQVESLMIDGDGRVESGDIYSKYAAVTVTYHSRG